MRIYPLYWAVTLVAVAMETRAITFGQHGLQPGYVAASMAIAPMPPPMVPFFSLGWTLEHEVVFYALAGLAGGVRLLFAVILALGLAGAVLQVRASAGQGEVPWLCTWWIGTTSISPLASVCSWHGAG